MASRYTDTRAFDYDGVNGVLEKLETKGKNFLDRLAVSPEHWKFELYCFARCPMQVIELDIPLEGIRVNPEMVSNLARAFHEAHRARYKTAEPVSPVEFVMWKYIARHVTSKTELPTQAYRGEDSSKALGRQRNTDFEDFSVLFGKFRF